MSRPWIRILLFGSLLGCGAGRGAAGGRDLPLVAAGPLAIETHVRKVSAGGFPNTSGNPFARREVTYFRVLHSGRPVVADPGGLALREFPAAWVLEGAPRPTVLAAASGVYLIGERDGRAEATELFPPDGDLVSLQWLDGRDGQPGEPIAVAIHDARGESRRLGGGRLLFVGRELVLDVATLEARPVRWWESREALDDFNPSNSPALALSPGGTQLVLLGDRRRNDAFEYALVAVDHRTNRAHAVPFAAEATRFESAADATPEWVAHYFAWQRLPDGTERLALRRDAVPRAWQGRFVRFSPTMVEYRLASARAELLAALRDFVARELGGEVAAVEEGGLRVVLRVRGQPLTLWYRGEERELSLYAETGPPEAAAATAALVEEVGRRFDAELATGRHQELFGSGTR